MEWSKWERNEMIQIEKERKIDARRKFEDAQRDRGHTFRQWKKEERNEMEWVKEIKKERAYSKIWRSREIEDTHLDREKTPTIVAKKNNNNNLI